MRILHVIASTNPEGGGPIEGVKQRGRVLRAMGHPIEIACFDAPDAPWLGDVGFPVHALGPSRGGYGYTPRMLPWLKAHGNEYDAVVVNGIWQYHSLAASLAMRALGKPYVVFTHGMLGRWFREQYPLKHVKKCFYWLLAEAWVLKHASAVLFTCEGEKLEAQDAFWPYRLQGRVVAYGTAGPPARTIGPTLRDTHPQLGEAEFLLFLGRIHPVKGVDLLVSAFVATASHTSSHLVIAGKDQCGMSAGLIQLVDQAGLSHRVHWVGPLQGDAKWEAIKSCSALILPSHHENFGIVVAEALACGKPVLISNKVNIWREVGAAGAGLVAEDTIDGTCELLRRWKEMSDGEKVKMAAMSRSCFLKHFEIAGSAEALVKVIEEVAGQVRQG